MSQTIERDSPVPYYEQLFGILKNRMLSGDIAVDDKLPSELELGREFGLSRATVRQTLTKLENEGYARRVARRGFFASNLDSRSGWIVQDQQGFLESTIRQGQTGVTTEVVAASFVSAPSHVTEALRLDRGAQVYALERVRSLDGRVAMFSTNWFPVAVGAIVAGAPDVLDGTGSVNTTLRDAGFVISGARRVISALLPPAAVAAHLRVGRDQPALRVRSLSWDAAGSRFDYYETWVLTDIIPLEVNVAAG